MGAVSVLGYYDWALPENRTNVGVVDPVWSLTDTSTGGSAVGATSSLTDRSIATSYGRDGMNRSSGHNFQIDIQTNTSSAPSAETPVVYGAIVISGCGVRKNSTNVWVPGKVTCTVDAHAGTIGTGAVFSRIALFGARGNDGRSTFPSPTVAFVPFSSTAAYQSAGGASDVACNKIRIKVEPTAGTGGALGVNVFDARIGRISIMRCFFVPVDPKSLKHESDDLSTVMRAADGTPYVNARRTVRRMSGKMINIGRAAQFGGAGATYRPANLVAVNVHAGIKNEVLFAQAAEPPASEISGNTYAESWTNQIIFGLLSDTLRAQLANKTSGGTDDFWTADFGITENTP